MWFNRRKGDDAPSGAPQKGGGKARGCVFATDLCRDCRSAAATSAESAIVPGTLSLEARAELQKEQMLDLNKYLYDLNSRKQLSRPKRTVSTYEPKQKEFIVSFRIHMSTDS